MPTLVKYLGKRETHVDSLFKTGVIWDGEGDIQEVADDKKAVKMATNHPDTYCIVTSTSAVPKAVPKGMSEAAEEGSILDSVMIAEKSGKQVKLRNASRVALEKYATEELGMKIMPAHTRAQILTFIANQEAIIHPDPKADA